jgi:cytidyltransferase-like protein
MKTVIISGYFSPLHAGHLDLLQGASALGDRLLVIVNNDAQQLIKKGKVVMDQDSRVRLMEALRVVDDVILSVDDELPVVKTMEAIATDPKYADDELIYAQGGDRDSDKVNPEVEVCERHGITIKYGVGTDIRGVKKVDSSTRIAQSLGLLD